MKKILIHCFSDDLVEDARVCFIEAGYQIAWADSLEDIVERLERELFDLFLVFTPVGDRECERIAVARSQHPTMPIVLIDSADSSMSADRARNLGVSEYLRQPIEPDTVLLHVEQALEAARLLEEHSYLIDQILEGESEVTLVGRSGAMERVREMIRKVATTRSSVLIIGESGTGKELVAQAIHHGSADRTQPLIKVNCPGIPAQLFESELFGHMKGSFTGAYESRKGRFELAGDGNILLDEVSEIPLELQAKMLRVLEDRRFTRVGGATEIDVRARVIASTNRDLPQLVREGGFREDLYYRLNVFPITMPPLRTRKEDISDTALHLLCHIGSACGLVAKGIDKDAMNALSAYDWPGNVRELRNILERALVLGGGGIVELEHLPWELQEVRADLDDGVDTFLSRVESYKKNLLLETLEENAWKKKEAASKLGLSQRAFSHYVSRYDLDRYRK